MTRHKRDLVCLADLRAGDPGIRDDKQASDYTDPGSLFCQIVIL